ncbi:MAG: DNA polymerase IV [Anaerolineae bacterium]|nr:DNA polymerase IV [Anaerolineae bacterium]
MRSPTRHILHVDLDAFFASVEELLCPELRGKPTAVGGPAGRGVIASASYAARRYGVRSAMPTSHALRLCPDLILLPPRRGVYGQFSRRVMDLLSEYSPLLEQVSIDEAFLDLTGCELRWGDAPSVARTIQKRILKEIGLSASLGLATSKLVAKIASDLEKPGGLVVVEPGTEAAFLAPLEVERLWGVGPVTAARLRGLGIRTIGDLAAYPERELLAALGPHARELQMRALGIDRSEVLPAREAKSVSREVTFAQDVPDAEEIRATLFALSERVAEDLRRHGLEGRTVTLKLRYPDFATLTRRRTLPHPTVLGQAIFRAAWDLFLDVWDRRPVRLVGVGVANLRPEGRQLSFLPGPEDRLRRLAEVMDHLRERYGEHALRPASLLKGRGAPSSGEGRQIPGQREEDRQ